MIFLLLFLNFSSADMTTDQVMNLVSAQVQKDKVDQDMVCKTETGKKKTTCLKDQMWLDLNSDTSSPSYKHKKQIIVTLFKNKKNQEDVCSQEVLVDPIKKEVLTKATSAGWDCHSASPSVDETPTHP